MKLTLGFSPCPNDTFIFDALVNQKIDTAGIEFEAQLEDVQTLNQWAVAQRLDITKISYGVLPEVTGHYRLLEAGGALGKGVGPLLIAGQPIAEEKVADCLVAIPGVNTTAHLLFSLAYPRAVAKKFMVFSDIEASVLSGAVDCGVIIHENRFTYQQKGLVKLADLGEYWEEKTGCPIPLGGIIMHQRHPADLVQKVNDLIRSSVEFAFSNYPELSPYVHQHAQEMEEGVMRQHIDLYVNNYTLALGPEGRKAVQKLMEVFADLHPQENTTAVSFMA